MLRDKLNRLSRDIAGNKDAENRDKKSDRYTILADCLRGQIIRQSHGSFIKIVTDFKDTYSHGKMMIMDHEQTSKFRRRHFHDSEEEILLDGRKLLFFDMETTGLGGAGTVPFLIGFGSITTKGFQVRQYFLPDFPDEEAMLEAVRSEIEADTVIVSYNGKTFDMPILTGRLILQRVERNLQIGDHIDLLHIARRMYRRRLQDCTLSNIEKNILDFHRIDDTPGYLVPTIYFNWLNYDDTSELTGIIQHNVYDIVSLFFLLHHFSAIGEQPEDRLSEPDDIYSLARIFQNKKEHEKVYELLESFDNISRSYERNDILFMQSLAYKRSGKFAKAAKMWEIISGSEAPEAYAAQIELAKYYEHKLRDFNMALKCAIYAQKICPPGEILQAEVKKRISRLKRKISR